MPASRKRPTAAASRAAAAVEAGITPVPDPGAEPTFITAVALVALGVDPATAGQAMTDALAVYRDINAAKPGPWVGQSALVTKANGRWGDDAVDRLNAAIGLLTNAGLVHLLG